MSEISPITPIAESVPKRSGDLPLEKKRIDAKVQEIVLSHIHRSQPSTLLAAISHPRIPILRPLVPAPQAKRWMQKRLMKAGEKRLPIGLSRCKAFPPLNALMQLLLFLSGFREPLSFVPKSCQPLGDFIEQYSLDQEKPLNISIADLELLAQFIQTKLALKPLNIAGFYFQLVRLGFGKIGFLKTASLAFHPEWHFCWDLSFPPWSAADIPSRPPEFLVTLSKKSSRLPPRQFFTKTDSHCYDLDGFLECREGHYIAYLKCDGIWYQCDDEKVACMRSTHLSVPLSRSVFLHYQKIWPI